MTLATQEAKQIPAQTRRDCDSPVLETERLKLRGPRRGDAKAIARFAGDLRVAANTVRIPHPYSVGDAEQFIAAVNRQNGEATFVITHDDAPIGACGVDVRESGPEIGYWLGVPYWGRGYATGARVSNPASRRVLEKCGFQWTSVGLYRIRAINSSGPFDRFRLDRGLWASLKARGRVGG